MSKEKDAIINSIMNHPKLSSVIHDAVSAPLGSTKRAKAKSILSIVKKSMSKYDGQGGPLNIGAQGNSLNTSLTQGLSIPSNFTPIPGLSLGGSSSGSSGLTTPPASTTKGTKVVVFPSAPTLKTNTNKLDTNIDSLMKSMFGNSYTPTTTKTNTPTKTEPLTLSPLKKVEDTSFLAGGSKTKLTAFDEFQKSVQDNIKLNQLKSNNTPVATTQTTVKKSDGTVSTTTKTTPAVTQTGSQTTQKVGNVTVPKTTGSSTTTPTPSSTTPRYATLEDAMGVAPSFIGQNTGSEYFAQQMLGLMEEGQIGKLGEELDKKYGVTELLNKAKELQDMSPNAVDTSIDYVKARDQYVSDINKMIDDVNETVANTDTSNPVTDAMYKNYKNYLYTLKGRQNQRYADYVDNNIKNFQSDLDNVKTQYTEAQGLYTSAMDNIEDRYDETKKVLIDMYKTLEDAPGKMLTRLNQQLTYNKLLQENADDAIGRKNWLPEVNAYKDRIIDKDGNLLGEINLPGALVQLSGDQKYNPIGVFDTFTNGAKNSLSKLQSSSDPSILKNAYNYSTQLDEAFSLLNPTAQKQLAPQIADMKNSLLNTVSGTIDPESGNGTGISGYILSNYKDINNAVKQLSGKNDNFWGTFTAKKKTPASRDQFIKDNPGIDKDILGAIYDSDQLTKSQLGSSYNIIDGLKNIAVPQNTSGGASLVGLPENQQLALYLTSRIIEPLKYQNVLNS